MKNKIAILAERFFALLIFSALLLAPTAAFAGLTEFFSATGRLSLSVDGAGSNNASHIAQVEKPNASATVRKAFVLAASTGFSGRVLNNGDVGINGIPINWDAQVSGAILNSNHRADVTSIVKPIVDAALPGRVTFTFTEVSTSGIDGESLIVVFDDPLQTADTTISLLFGAQNISGDTFSITLAEPIDPNSPGAVADFGLGISFGFQGTGQFSIVDVNGRRLTSSAGGQDDGVAANGALITVGGLDDSNANPDPNAAPSGPRTDDELYSLIKGNSVDSNPFITASDTSISVFTRNPSNDDNIFFAYFHLSGAAIVGEGIVLSPTSASNPVGTQHTVTAKVSNQNGAPVQGALVTFNVISGPNGGDTGTNTTDVNGEATFTYTGDGGAGTDQIQASFVDSQEITKTSNTVTKEWTPTEANTPPVADPQSVTTAEDTSKTITLTGSDADNDPLTCDVVTPPEHGTVTECTAATKAQLSRARSQLKTRLQKERKIPGTRGYGLKSKELAAIVQSTLANTVLYTPDPNYNGPDSFTFKVNDGKVDSASATVSITVTPVNDAPELQNSPKPQIMKFGPPPVPYPTPGINAYFQVRDVDGEQFLRLTGSFTARNVPKGCGSDVLASDPVPFSFPPPDEIVSNPPTVFGDRNVKAAEIGSGAMTVAREHSCNVTLEITNFTIQASDPAGAPSNILSGGSACVDSDSPNVVTFPCNTATAAVSRQLGSAGAAKKISPPVVR